MFGEARVEMRLEKGGVDLQSDEGAALYQDELEREIERERKRLWQMPPQTSERVNGIRI